MYTTLYAGLAGATLALSVVARTATTPSPDEEQAVADAAIAAFSERMIAAGFAAGEAGNDPYDTEELPPHCLADLELIEAIDDPSSGYDETARAESADFTLPVPGAAVEVDLGPNGSDDLDVADGDDQAADDGDDQAVDDPDDGTEPGASIDDPNDSTEPEDSVEGDDGDSDVEVGEQTANATVITFAEADRQVATEAVAAIGSQSAADCITEAFLAEFEADDPDGTGPHGVSVTFAASAEADLGIGDTSGRLDFTFGVEYYGEAFTAEITLVAAQVDRSLVLVGVGNSGEDDRRPTVVDPVAEVTTIVAALEATS